MPQPLRRTPPRTPCRGCLRAVSLVALASAVAMGCAEAATHDRPEDWQAVRDTVGDTLVVRTVSGSMWADTARLVPELEIGRLDGPEEYTFGRITGIAPIADGGVMVVDRQVPALRRYAPDGTFVRTFGGEGGGPGEYASPDGGVVVRSDGSVVLRDPANGRMTVFDGEGELVDTWPTRGGFNTSRPMYVDARDHLYTQLLINPGSDITDWMIGLLEFLPDGSLGDTLRPPQPDFEETLLIAQREGSTSTTHVPFSRRDRVTFSPQGYWVYGVTDVYAITLLKPGGPLRIERELPAVPVTAAERSYQRDRTTRNMRTTDPAWDWDGPGIPSHKPFFKDIYVGQDGRIWVHLSQPAVEVDNPNHDPDQEFSPRTIWREPPVFDVFEPDGTYLGAVVAPEGMSTNPHPIPSGDTVWAVLRDALDVQRVARLRITREVSEPQ